VTVQRSRKSSVLDVKPEQEAAYAASWKKIEEVVVLLQKEGVPMVPGTDDVAGLVLHSELEAWVKAGMPDDQGRRVLLPGRDLHRRGRAAVRAARRGGDEAARAAAPALRTPESAQFEQFLLNAGSAPAQPPDNRAVLPGAPLAECPRMLKTLVPLLFLCACGEAALAPCLDDLPDAAAPDAGPEAPADLAGELAPIRATHAVPALGAAVVKGGQLAAIGAVGVRRLGDPAPVSIDDQWHLGSNTKAMTATVAALLVDEGSLAWSTTVGASFPEPGAALSPAYAPVTLEQLLAHRGGLPRNPAVEVGEEMRRRDPDPPAVVRAWAVEEMLKAAPAGAAGDYAYSNLGYMTAGRIIEKRAGTAWETLVRTRLFEPLGMTRCGLGAPGTRGDVDEPWGHFDTGTELVPLQYDNPASVGPAGTVHCSLGDWAKFAALHLAGARQEHALLSAAGFAKLHSPVAGGDYALGLVVKGGSPRQIWHSGSNLFWYAQLWLIPERDVAILVATNCANAACQKAVTDTVDHLRRSWAP
jgi:CubicO group peptidase (beta-lactamase class C family)